MNKLFIIKGNIVKSKSDAIVNAANTSLLGGGGVDGAIHKAAGKELLQECRMLNGCKTGQAKITKGYKLLAKYIIHTPGPVWRGGNYGEENLLADCYKNCLKLAEENNIKSISFPSISTGIYHFPVEKASVIAVREIMQFLNTHENIERVEVICFDENTFETYKKACAQYKA